MSTDVKRIIKETIRTITIQFLQIDVQTRIFM